jgi:enoyl-CoA hydratase/carnithine racemase
MVEFAVPRSQLEEQARAVVERIAALPEHALCAAKQCIAAARPSSPHGYLLERELGGRLLESEVTKQLITQFLERSASKALAKSAGS